MNELTEYTVCIGSNSLAAVEFDRAVCEVARTLTHVKRSNIYASADCSNPQGREYLNCVVRGFSSLDSESLDLCYKNIEAKFGRRRPAVCGEVALDVDIVVAGENIIRPHDYVSEHFRRGINGTELLS